MGTVYKKAVTRPLPAKATVSQKRRRATAKELREGHKRGHRFIGYRRAGRRIQYISIQFEPSCVCSMICFAGSLVYA
jgi:hypothetical protein